MRDGIGKTCGPLAAFAWALVLAACAQEQEKPSAQSHEKPASPAASSDPVNAGPSASESSARGPVQGPGGSPYESKPIFNTQCAACHGVDGKGLGPRSASLSLRPRDFTDRMYMSTRDRALLRRIIEFGGESAGLSPQMPGFGKRLRSDDIDLLVDYVLSFSQ